MDQSTDSFETLMDGIRSGSRDAAWELVSKFGREVERTIRRMLNHKLRSKFDTVDFAQAVWASFFRERDRFKSFESPAQLIGYLTGIAQHKVLSESRKRFDTLKSDVRREQSLDADHSRDSSTMQRTSESPSQWAMAREKWEEIMRDHSPEHQQIIQMRIAGDTFEEIGEKLGINERTARRVIDRLVKEFEQ